MPQKNPVYHNRQKTFLKDGTAVKQRSAFVDPANPRHIKSRIKGGRKELRLPSITYTYHEKDDSLS